MFARDSRPVSNGYARDVKARVGNKKPKIVKIIILRR
jgi:hypothetical protein